MSMTRPSRGENGRPTLARVAVIAFNAHQAPRVPLRRAPPICYRHRVARAPGAPSGPGKAVESRRDPVTVIGDETRERHWPSGREGAGSRTIREPGDLPGRAP